MIVADQPSVSRIRRWRTAIIIEVMAVAIVVIGFFVVRAIDLNPTPTSLPTGDEQARLRDEPILYGYGWVDQKAGIAHIPIQRAIDMVAQNGLPSRPASAQSAKDQGLTIPSYSSSGTQPAQVLH